MAFEIGKTAGGYEFLDVLDSTKTGVAYKVRNLKFGRVEMLRILPRNLQEDQERVERSRLAGAHLVAGRSRSVAFSGDRDTGDRSRKSAR